MTENPGPMKNGHYVRQWWRELAPAAKKRGWLALAILSTLWLAGAWVAPRAVAGIGRLEGLARLLMSLGMGGFSFPWGGFKALGVIQETAQDPNLLWIPLALALPAAVYGFIVLLDRPPNPLFGIQKKLAGLAYSQGHVAEDDVAQKLIITAGVPFATVANARKKPVKVGLDFAAGEGHVLVTGPTRSGKGLHLTDTLLTWPGPALVVDPKREQLGRTAGWRSQFGPIYCLPGHRVALAGYYRQLLDRDDIAELHTHLIRPWDSRETIFAEKAMSLFTAAGLYARARALDPLRVLLDLAESDPAEALTGLETVPAARRHVRVFTNGASPTDYREDKFVTSAYGNFTTRLATYQKHIDTIAPSGGRLVIDPNWARQNGTIYLTYSLQDLQGVGGVVAAIIAAMLRYQMQQERRERLLVAIDELPAVGLRNVANYLATAGGYGITLLLYVQSLSQVKELYGPEGSQAILSNCAHQIWYPPAEYETAAAISNLYGMTLRANPVHSLSRGARQQKDREGRALSQTNSNQGASWSWQERPALLPSQALALTKEQVLVSTLAGRRYVFLGQRLNPIPLFDRLPPATLLRLPKPVYGERLYTRWQEMGSGSAGTTGQEAVSREVVPAAGEALNDTDAGRSLAGQARVADDGESARDAF
ncbi:MAG: type IV secretory system conjugative DNA transfer family protein [Candidatus Promineifilaceae bacterium]